MKTSLTVLFIIFTSFLNAQNDSIKINTKNIIYKNINGYDLNMKVISSKDNKNSKTAKQQNSKAAIVFFFGGGWKTGSISQFEHQARYFSERGLVSFLVNYRTENKHGTTPFSSLMDAKSAIRFIRENASEFNISTDKIIAAGASAGGHLAAALATIEGYNSQSDDLEVSCKPNALILFNPVIDNGPGGYGYERIGDNYKDFSPLHNLSGKLPPTIIFLGKADKLIPVVTMKYYKLVMEKLNVICELNLYDNVGHGFFNYSEEDQKYYRDTLLKAEKFLIDQGFMK